MFTEALKVQNDLIIALCLLTVFVFFAALSTDV